jgi:hypothetical protein
LQELDGTRLSVVHIVPESKITYLENTTRASAGECRSSEEALEVEYHLVQEIARQVAQLRILERHAGDSAADATSSALAWQRVRAGG